MLTIGIAKGKVESFFFEKLGKHYDITNVVNRGKKLLVKLDEIEIVFIKAKDIGLYLDNNIIDIAVVGSDILDEYFENKYLKLKLLEMGNCFIGLASNSTNHEFWNNCVIGTEYPNITKKYFANQNKNFNILELHGSTEVSVIVGLCDFIVDIIETGNTIKANNLQIINKIADVKVALISKKESAEIKHFIENLD